MGAELIGLRPRGNGSPPDDQNVPWTARSAGESRGARAGATTSRTPATLSTSSTRSRCSRRSSSGAARPEVRTRQLQSWRAVARGGCRGGRSTHQRRHDASTRDVASRTSCRRVLSAATCPSRRQNPRRSKRHRGACGRAGTACAARLTDRSIPDAEAGPYRAGVDCDGLGRARSAARCGCRGRDARLGCDGTGRQDCVRGRGHARLIGDIRAGAVRVR